MFSQKFGLFICFFVFFPIFIYSQTSVPYTNGKYGYKINLPKDWKMQFKPSEEDPQLVIAANEDGSNLSVYATQDKKLEGKNPETLGMNYFFDIVQAQFPSALYIQSESETIDNQPVIYAKYSYRNGNDDYTIGQFYVVIKDMFYTIQLFAKTNLYEPFEDIGKGLAYTFKGMNANASKYFKSDRFGFRISFPEGWQTIIDRPPFEAYDNKGGSVIIEIMESNNYKGITANDLDINDMIESIRKNKKDAILLEKSYIGIEGVPALYGKYQWDEMVGNEKTTIIVQHYYIIKNKKLYILQTIVPLKQFYNYRDKFKACVESFQFTE